MSKPGRRPSGAAPAAREAAPITDDELRPVFDRLFGGAGCVVLAVSGGIDSMALMHLAARWRGRRGADAPELHVATVDHGLRAEAALEAGWVATRAASIGLRHHTLVWLGAKPQTGLQQAARDARYSLLLELAGRLSPAPRNIAVAHTCLGGLKNKL